MSTEESLSNLPRSDRLFQLVQQLLAMPATDLKETVDQAAQLITQVLAAEKVDVFLYDAESQSLIAFGTSVTPMGIHQKEIGLDRIPLAQGGRTVEVYQTGQPYQTGQAQSDPYELAGVKEDLGIQSEIAVPLSVGTERRGVLLVTSSATHRFQESDLPVVKAIANWVSLVVHRAELSENYANELADRARRMEAETLLTVMAHDLRNDLTPLKGRLELLIRRARREGLFSFGRELEITNRGIERLNRLVSDLLDAERLKQGPFALHQQEIDLVQLVEDVVPIWSVPGHPIQVQAPASLVAMADPDRIQQILENLLSNATTHAYQDTPIEMVVTQESRTEQTCALITVTNQGPPLSPDQRKSLFQPFTKGAQSRGLGVGLYISQRIAQAHHGTLTAHMDAEGLTHFTLALPLQPACASSSG